MYVRDARGTDRGQLQQLREAASAERSAPNSDGGQRVQTTGRLLRERGTCRMTHRRLAVVLACTITFLPFAAIQIAFASVTNAQVVGDGSWTRGAAMPSERGEVGAAVVDNRIYVVGAYSGASDANEGYDPDTDSWRTLAPLPQSRNHVCAAAVGGRLYIIGGFDPATGNRPVDTTYAYDPGTDTWASHAPIPTPRGALACVAVGDTIYAIGGASPAGATGVNEAYEPVTDTWRTDPMAMPTSREHLAAAELGGLVHVFGGRSLGLGLSAATHEVYDPVANTWTSAAALPTGRSGIGAAVLRGRIHVLGGEADNTFEQNEAYDPVTDSWVTFAPLPTPRHGLGVVTVRDAIYVLAGGLLPGDSRSNIVEVFRLP